jgi:aarF domain-containing kinase
VQALVFADVKGIKENSVKLGAGEDLYVLFAGVLTMRPWQKVLDPAIDHLRLNGTDVDRAELQVFLSCVL